MKHGLQGPSGIPPGMHVYDHELLMQCHLYRRPSYTKIGGQGSPLFCAVSTDVFVS